MFKGSLTALITPFTAGKVDEEALISLIEWQIEQGSHGLVSCGTTGESPTLDHDEHNRVTEMCIRAAGKRVPVLAGTGSNATAEAVQLTRHAEKAGAAGALVVTPYYNKPTQEGLFQHFKAIHDHSNIPIILYDIPGRSVVPIKDETIARLAKICPRIIGIKDATGNLERPQQLSNALKNIRGDFIQLSGEDALAVEYNRRGGAGCISVTANIAPRLCARMQQACLDGDYKLACEIQENLMPLHDAMFCETSPGPVKYAASLMNLCKEEYRLPLVPPSEENKKIIRKALENTGLI